MIRKGLLLINVLALILSGLTYSWMYSEHSELTATKSENFYETKLQEINTLSTVDSIKDSYIQYLNENKNSIRIHNYASEKYINALLAVIILLGLNFVFLTILNEQSKKIVKD
ncbi:MAG: hypothetical protein OQK75_06800 [Gammaproteobacteria bacterium]|nr:hypothetical protein [Gammaproteobacteria bacterium]MCW8987366.1 hypothetical protein [Gammaproteobacteria bacterium]